MLIEVKKEDKDSINNAMKGKNFNFPTLSTKDHKGEEIDIFRDISDPLDDNHIKADGNALVLSLQAYTGEKIFRIRPRRDKRISKSIILRKLLS